MAMRRPGPIAAAERVVMAPVERVWAFLADPQSYAGWVSGTSRIRHADRNWPEVGAQLHHCWGVGPLRVRDRTTVLAAEPPHRLVLLARARPVGVVRAEIEVTVEPAGTHIVLTEELLSGWATRWPRVTGLVQQLRNRRSVRRLAVLAAAVDRTSDWLYLHAEPRGSGRRLGMAVNTVHIDRSPEQVFEVLADGWKFTNWVVGTSHMRAVTGDWPAAGAKLHHAFGGWPLMRRDETVVDTVAPNERLELTAKGRPFGRAKIVIEIKPTGTGCDVTLAETVVSGPLLAAHNRVTDVLLAKRNAESLARFKALVERPTEPVEGT